VSLKEELHSLIDRLPESEQLAAHRFLELLCACDGYDEPLSSEEAAQSERAWKDYIEGRDAGMSLEEARRKLL
jgi:hypothetical protein